ncbi:78_t:CDS:2 [Ambispora gerdemannii]|uniref:78_t:CDS:1 n=1 Tax=Ambispora gerdemannii TaxID=144530 RepID=A0A9N9AKP1_9GLOM|nr:78_t:CDS:2 [Ambispora gerdemannii]
MASDQDIIYIYDTSLRLVKRCANLKKLLKFLDVHPNNPFSVVKFINSGKLYEGKYYLSNGSTIVPTLQRGIDTNRVELFSNSPTGVFVYNQSFSKILYKYQTKSEAAQALECPVAMLDYFIDKNLLFKDRYFLLSKSIDRRLNGLKFDEKLKGSDKNASHASDADNESSSSAISDISSSESDEEDEHPFRETDFQEMDGFRNCQEFPKILGRLRATICLGKGKASRLLELDALRREYESKTIVNKRSTPKRERRTLVEGDKLEPLDFPSSELLEAVNKFAANHFKKNDLENIFEEMNGTALVAIGIIIQEYVRNVMLKPPE